MTNDFPGYHHSKVKNEFLHYPRRVVCSHLDKKVEGLAQLLLFDFACKSRNPKNLLGPSYYGDNSIRTKHLELSKVLDSKESDYLDLTAIKYDRKPPAKLFKSINIQVSKLLETHFFIHSLNDLETILNRENSLDSTDVPNRIEWNTVNPTTQRVGSFNPISTNFYKVCFIFCTNS